MSAGEQLFGRNSDSRSRSLAASVEERLVVPIYSSRWDFAAKAAHRGLSLPFQLLGQVRRRSISFEGAQIGLVEIGREKLVRPISTRLFGELPAPAQEPRRAVWNPASVVSVGADVVLAEVHRWMVERFRSAGWLIVPHSVRWEGELESIPPRAPSHGLLDNLRKIRKYGFQIEQATTAADWDEFYWDMVRPQALTRYGPTAYLPSQRLMAEFARVGTLHFITRGSERVAGVCSVGQGDVLWMPVSGIRRGDPALLQQGAGAAIFGLTIEWARAQGYRRLDAGRTGPFIKDGLQQFKRKWGLLPVTDPLTHVVAIWAGSPSIRRAFALEPVLVEDGRGLQTYAGQ